MQKKIRILMGLVIFILLYSLTFISLHVHESNKYLMYLDNTRNLSNLTFNFLNERVEGCINNMIRDLEFLESEVKLHKLKLEEIEKLMINFANSKEIYDQIRILDYAGMEILRIDFENGEAISQEKYLLQDKSDRYYYKKTINNSNSIYISPLDLNIENGEIEVPFLPTIRLSKRIEGEDGYSYILVLNYKANNILKLIEEYDVMSENEIFLLNEDGYYLYSNNESSNFAFMFSDKLNENILNHFKVESLDIDKMIFNNSKIILIRKYEPSYNLSNKNFKIVEDVNLYFFQLIDIPEEYLSLIDKDQVYAFYKEMMKKPLLILICIVCSYIVVKIFYWWKNFLKDLKKKTERDMITGILNRATGTKRIDELIRNSNSTIKHCLCFIDLDDFKKINDTLGHKKGDAVLEMFTNFVVNAIRKDDIFLRYGGDEFIVFFPDTNKVLSNEIFQKINSDIENYNDNSQITIKFSVGVVEFAKNEISVSEAIELADDEMYKVKTDKCKI